MHLSPWLLCRSMFVMLFLSLLFLSSVSGTRVLVQADSLLKIDPIADITAHADEHVKIHAMVTSASGNPLSFIWEQHNPTLLSLRDDMTDTVYFVAPRVSTQTDYQLLFLVSDGITQAHTTVNVKVLPYQPQQPLANAGPDQNVHAQDIVTLDGSHSSDGDSLALTYLWQQLSGPTVVFAPTQMVTTFVAPAVSQTTALEFRLSVRDEQSDGNDTVRVVVTPTATSLPTISSPQVVVSPVTSTPMTILTQSDLRRSDIVREMHYVCFADQHLDTAREATLDQRLLQIDSQDLNEVGVSKIDMLRDVLVLCGLQSWPSTISSTSHYPDITGANPGWWSAYANYAFAHHLFDNQPLFLPTKTMNRTDLRAFLAQVQVLKRSLIPTVPATVSSSPVTTTIPLSVTQKTVVQKSMPAVNSNASASILNKVLEPKVAAFGILCLVGFLCLVYGLFSSRKSRFQKQTHITLPNSTPHDRR